MMGLVTVAQLDKPRQSRRAQTQELLARTAEIACDNAALGRQFVELMPELPESSRSSRARSRNRRCGSATRCSHR